MKVCEQEVWPESLRELFSLPALSNKGKFQKDVFLKSHSWLLHIVAVV